MRRFSKYVLRFVLFLSVFVMVYFLAAYLLSRITLNKNVVAGNDVTIYIMSNGIHTDIVVPACNEQMDWRKEIKFSDTKAADTTAIFLAMGWGDRKFYLETPEFKDLKISTGLNAIFGLSTSAMHTTYYNILVEDAQCKRVSISKKQYSELIRYLKSSFILDQNGHVKNIKTNLNYDDHDAFYEAVGSYSLFKTCNTWANNALKSCGQKCCYWTIFDTPILLKYR